MRDISSSQETFIIRLWKKSPQELAWRGQLQNVRTGQQIVIHNLLDLLSCFDDFFPTEGEIEFPIKKPGLK